MIQTSDDDEVARVLQSFHDTKNELAQLRQANARLESDLAIERAKLEQLDKSYRSILAERDLYMRQTVELRGQLTNAATILTGAVERSTVLAQNAQTKTLEDSHPQPLPRIVSQGPAS